MVSRTPLQPQVIQLLVLLLLVVVVLLPSFSSAQDFRSIGYLQEDVSRQIQGIQLPPFCPPNNDDNNGENDVEMMKVPPNLVVTIIPASDESLVDIRTAPPNLVTAFVNDDLSLGFFWNFEAIAEAMENAQLITSQEQQQSEDKFLECGMIIQIPNSALQRLDAWGGGITIQLLVGSTELSHIRLHEGAILHAVLEEARPSVTMSGMGTEATISSEQGVRRAEVTNDATLKLSGNILNNLMVDRASVHLEGTILAGKEVYNILDNMVDTSSETEMEPNDDVLPVLQQSTVSSKGILTVSDSGVCEGVVLSLAGECVVDSDLHIFADVGGSLTSHRIDDANVNNTSLMLLSPSLGDVEDTSFSSWLTCISHLQSDALSSSGATSAMTAISAVLGVAAATTTTLSMMLSLMIGGIE